ncbi:septum site-determining protein MinC [Gudongella oleilytica]|jgi:septum site-determining protein MinC|uniref:septum site-determining protein MinC n=1 Tax=Gudongella oleilytica TaxID=1582259 RepID=UPI000ECFFC48|nr:septum site-determining protein MinC [Gudongella oleilytica]MDY0255586.1 septum site-determining protein MinC [Gudongella oleilytica]HCO18347.1 septum site-determining protein MinC [Tissierellales bacterium]HMM69036.1 septum site-determining protein MinC [Gudongella oleilytica]
MKNDLVTIKGMADGMYIEVRGNDLESLTTAIHEKIMKAGEFFKGGKLIEVRGDELSPENRLELMLILKYKYDFKVDIPGISVPVAEEEKTEPAKINVFEAEEGLSKFVHGTLRSGQEIAFNGNIVVIGDVNPGAQLKAKGNIVVLGSLKGLAHAGVGGNTKAVVAAYSLLPTQLRIADLIVRPPEDDTQYKYPEIARIVDGEVVIEPYLPNK